MVNYLTLAAKVQLNVHDLNNEAVAGNVTDIRLISFLNEENDVIEAPAVSGRMLKHWHYECMRKIIGSRKNGISLCSSCEIGEPLRPGFLIEEGDSKKLTQKTPLDEKAIISNCAICDVHGFLIAQEGNSGKSSEDGSGSAKRTQKTQGISSRRNSRVLFSWLLPVIGTEPLRNQVIHSRVTSRAFQDEGEKSSQMIFSKSYASGLYGFVSALDLKRIGFSEFNLKNLPEHAFIDRATRKDRMEIAIEAYRLMLTGQMGASLSHALPHAKPVELLVCYSTDGPIPFPVSPIYRNYIGNTIGILPEHAKLLYWSEAEGQVKEEMSERIEIMNTIDDIFKKIFEELSASN